MGTTNINKINAIKDAFLEKYIQVEAKGFGIASGVSDQPMSSDETETGAKNRAQGVLDYFTKNRSLGIPDYSTETENRDVYFVGVENGLHQNEEGDWFDLAKVVIRKWGEEKVSIAESTALSVPMSTDKRPWNSLSGDEKDHYLFQYRQIIMPIINQGKDLYQFLTKNRLSRQSVLQETARKALTFLKER